MGKYTEMLGGKYAKMQAPAEYGVGNELLSGLTFGFGDELRSKITGEPIEAVRAGQDAYRKENPVASTVANIVGSLPVGGVLGKGVIAAAKGVGSRIPIIGSAGAAIAEGAPSILRVPTQAAVIGGTEGAVRGVGEGTGAGQGFITGTLGGTAGGVLGAVASKGAQKVSGKSISPLEARIGERARAAGLNEASVIPKGQSLAEQGGTVVRGRLEGPLQRLAGATYRRSDKASATVPQVLSDRETALRTDLPSQISDALRASPDIGDYASMRRAQAQPLYDQAFASRLMVDPDEVQQIMAQPAAMAAYNQAAQNFGALGRRAPSLGDVMSGNAPLEFMDAVKRQLQKVYSKAETPMAPSGVVADRQALEALSGRFTNALRTGADPSYSKALDVSGDAIRMEKAFEAGKKLYGAPADKINDAMKGMTEDAQQGFRSGLAYAAQELANSQRDTATQTLISRLIGSPQARQGLEVAGADPLMLRLAKDRAEKQVAFGNSLGGGSPTALNQVADDALQTDLQAAVKFTKNIPNAISDILLQGQFGKNADRASDILFNFDDQLANQETLKRILEAERKLAALRGNTAAFGGAGGSAAASGLLGDSQ